MADNKNVHLVDRLAELDQAFRETEKAVVYECVTCGALVREDSRENHFDWHKRIRKAIPI